MNDAYRELKLAWQLHGQAPDALPAETRQQLRGTVSRQQALESLILQSPEAMHTAVSPQLLKERLAELQARYPDRAEFLADLKRLGLDEESLETQVARDLLIDGTLERVAADTPAVTETEAEIYYRLHPERFAIPERRQLRHLLMTAPSAAEEAAIERQLQQLRASLTDAEAFAAAALRLSHCPTSLDGGLLGWVRCGQLYAELNAVAFALAAGTVSPPVHSEMGWHLLRCDAIEPGRRLSFAEVRSDLMQRLDERRRERRQRQWIAALGRLAAGSQPVQTSC